MEHQMPISRVIWIICLISGSSGADNTKDDGVYSAYFYQYSGDGAYITRAYANGTGGQTYILRETRELQYDPTSSTYQGIIFQ